MIKLHARLEKRRDAEPFVARVVAGRLPAGRRTVIAKSSSWIGGSRPPRLSGLPGRRGTRRRPAIRRIRRSGRSPSPCTTSPTATSSGSARVPANSGSCTGASLPSNSMLLTERCNSYCVMCSQPPKAGDDGHLVAGLPGRHPADVPRDARAGDHGRRADAPGRRPDGDHPDVPGVPAGYRAAHALERQAVQLPVALPGGRGDRPSGPDGRHPALFGHPASPRLRRAGRRGVRPDDPRHHEPGPVRRLGGDPRRPPPPDRRPAPAARPVHRPEPPLRGPRGADGAGDDGLRQDEPGFALGRPGRLPAATPRGASTTCTGTASTSRSTTTSCASWTASSGRSPGRASPTGRTSTWTSASAAPSGTECGGFFASSSLRRSAHIRPTLPRDALRGVRRRLPTPLTP